MPVKPVIAVLLLATSTFASPAKLNVRAQLKPAGCKQTIVGTKVEIRGCTAAGPIAGTVAGRLSLSYVADADIARGGGTQHGTMTLTSASGKDTLVATFSGVVSIATGASHGTWVATSRSGAFLHLAGRRGGYASRTPDQGVHVTFDVHG